MAEFESDFNDFEEDQVLELEETDDWGEFLVLSFF